jgi:hypothetical protein
MGTIMHDAKHCKNAMRALGQENTELRAELAALKARSCSGCDWYEKDDEHGYCYLWIKLFPREWNPDKDHCSRWEKRDEDQAAGG